MAVQPSTVQQQCSFHHVNAFSCSQQIYKKLHKCCW